VDSATQISALQSQLAALQTQVSAINQRVMGNDPSSNYNPLGSGGLSNAITGVINLAYQALIQAWNSTSNALIAWIGTFIVSGVQYFGAWFQSLYVGGSDAAHAFLVASAGSLSVTGTITASNITGSTFTAGGAGTPGLIEVLDNTGAEIGWLGEKTISSILYQGGWLENLWTGGANASAAVFSVVGGTANLNGTLAVTGTISGGTISAAAIVGSTIVLNQNSITTTIDNHTFSGLFVGLEIQNNTSKDAFYATPDFLELTNGDPSLSKPRFNAGNNGTAGIARVFDGTGGGGIAGHGEQHVFDGSNGNYTLQGIINFNGQTLGGAASAGGVAIPATCDGFLTIEVAGVTKKLAVFH